MSELVVSRVLNMSYTTVRKILTVDFAFLSFEKCTPIDSLCTYCKTLRASKKFCTSILGSNDG